jgi:hypothetical protein
MWLKKMHAILFLLIFDLLTWCVTHQKQVSQCCFCQTKLNKFANCDPNVIMILINALQILVMLHPII